MIYIFKDNKLVREVKERPDYSMHDLNCFEHKQIPTDSYIYSSYDGEWCVKRTRAYLRPVPKDQLPKECRAMLLLLGVQCG